MFTYRSRRHPNNGVTYIVIREIGGGEVLVSSSGCEYRGCWDWSDLERIDG